ncbi:MAG TPA: hypothetical protein VFF31_08285 [Blastocatellia bacterium]|jgi:hypothetical protein|nr:hypothetical protein [Blastocatellia bacterium]
MLVSTQMITGFNTDVRHEGHVYHVQTEDGGRDNPILESLIYVGGTIVAKKLTPYPDLIDEDARRETLSSLLKRQHQVIIAAIKAGRIDDLIRHSLKYQTANAPQEEQTTTPSPHEAGVAHAFADSGELPLGADHRDEISPNSAIPIEEPAPLFPAANPSPNSVRAGGRSSGAVKAGAPARGETGGLNLDQVLEDYVKRGGGHAKLDVKVLNPQVFTAGKSVGLRVQVTHETKPDFDATVTVKIIGTAFKPQVFIGRVGRDGVANFSLTLPSFSTGTAAIVIEAQSGTGHGELKNLIRRA